MSSTSSAISTPTPDARRWRRLLAILLILAAATFVALRTPALLSDRRDAQRQDDLTWAAATAEEVEAQLSDGKANLGYLYKPLFTASADLAYIRIWDQQGRLRSEGIRGTDTPPSSRSTLPDLEVTSRTKALARQARDSDWLLTVAQLQELLLNQTELTERMEQARDAGKAAGNHGDLYLRQDDALRAAKALAPEHPLLADAPDEMGRCLDALTRNDAAALQHAIDASGDAETSVALALEDFRAVADTLSTLPPQLLRHAPPPLTRWQRMWPAVQGRRMLVPLFGPGNADTPLTALGYAEIVLFDRPADVLPAWLATCWPALVLLAGAIILFALPRRNDSLLRQERP